MPNPWGAIVGRQSDGRSLTVARVVERLREEGLHVGGFLQAPAREGEAIVGWDAVDLHTGERLPLARISDEPDLCDWRFDPQAIATCRAWTRAAPFDVVVLEAGSLEASGGGHWDALEGLLEGPPCVPLVGIRPRALAVLGLRLPDPVAGIELPATRQDVDALVEALVELTGHADHGAARASDAPG